MDFVDDDDPVTAVGREVLDAVAQVADIVHAVIGSAVNLENIGRGAFGYLDALRADVTGLVRDPLFAVEGLGHDTGGTGFADSAGAGKQEGMGNPSCVNGILQSTADMFLAGQLGKVLGAVFPCQDFIVRAGGQEI